MSNTREARTSWSSGSDCASTAGGTGPIRDQETHILLAVQFGKNKTKNNTKRCHIKIYYIKITYAKTSPELGNRDTEMNDTLPALKEIAA